MSADHPTRPTGSIFAVVGPSGAGKDTLLEGAAAALPDLVVARRVITRAAQPGGEPFEGVTDAEFDARLAAGNFALHWRAHGLSYGIPRGIDDDLAQGRTVVFNGSRQALAAAAARFPGLVVVLVTAPVAALAERLSRRGRETRADIAARLDRADFDLPPGIPARVVMNDATLAIGTARLIAALQTPSA